MCWLLPYPPLSSSLHTFQLSVTIKVLFFPQCLLSHFFVFVSRRFTLWFWITLTTKVRRSFSCSHDAASSVTVQWGSNIYYWVCSPCWSLILGNLKNCKGMWPQALFFAGGNTVSRKGVVRWVTAWKRWKIFFLQQKSIFFLKFFFLPLEYGLWSRQCFWIKLRWICQPEKYKKNIHGQWLRS